MKRLFLAVFLAFSFASVSFADWMVPNNNKKLGDSFNPAAATHLLFMPTSAIGYGLGAGNPVYGYSGGFDLILANKKESGNGQTSIVPLIGGGVDAFLDVAPLINQGAAPRALLGFNGIGPQIENLVPTIQANWDINSNEFKVIAGISAPFGPLADLLLVDLGRIF